METTSGRKRMMIDPVDDDQPTGSPAESAGRSASTVATTDRGTDSRRARRGVRHTHSEREREGGGGERGTREGGGRDVSSRAAAAPPRGPPQQRRGPGERVRAKQVDHGGGCIIGVVDTATDQPAWRGDSHALVVGVGGGRAGARARDGNKSSLVCRGRATSKGEEATRVSWERLRRSRRCRRRRVGGRRRRRRRRRRGGRRRRTGRGWI